MNPSGGVFKPQASRGRDGPKVTGSAPPDLIHAPKYNPKAKIFVPGSGASQGGAQKGGAKNAGTGGKSFNRNAPTFNPTAKSWTPKSDANKSVAQNKPKNLNTISEEATNEEQKNTEVKTQQGSQVIKNVMNQGTSKEGQKPIHQIKEFRPTNTKQNTSTADKGAAAASTVSKDTKKTTTTESAKVATAEVPEKKKEVVSSPSKVQPVVSQKTETVAKELKKENEVKTEEVKAETKVEPKVETPKIEESKKTTVAPTTSSAETIPGLADAISKRVYSTDIILKFKGTESCKLAPADLTTYEFYSKMSTVRKPNRNQGGMLPNPRGGQRGDRSDKRGGNTRGPNRQGTLTRKTYDEDQIKILNAAKEARAQREANKNKASDQQKLRKEAQRLTNQITKTNFEAIGRNIVELAKKSYDQLRAVVEQIMKKAWSEPRFCEIYATLCKMLDEAKLTYNEVPKEAKKNPFKVALLSQIQEVFERSAGARSAEEDEDIDEKKVLANVKLIGELFKLALIKNSIIFTCASSLLYKKVVKDGAMILTNEIEYDEKRIFGCCDLLSICGKELLKKKKKSELDKLVDTLKRIQGEKEKITSKTRFRIMDIIDLQANNWVSTSIKDTKVKTVDEIHQEFKQEQRDAAQRAREMKQEEMMNSRNHRNSMQSSNNNSGRMVRKEQPSRKSNIFDQVHAMADDVEEEDEEVKNEEVIQKLPPFANDAEMNTKVSDLFTSYAIRHSVSKLVKDFKYQVLSRIEKEDDFIYRTLNALFDKKEDMMQIFGSCFAVLIERDGFAKKSFIDGLATFCEFAPMVEPDIPKLTDYLAIVLSRFLFESSVELSELRIAISEVEFDQPFYQKFFVRLFASMYKLNNDQEHLRELFKKSTIQETLLKVFLKNEGDLKSAFEGKDLGFLFTETHADKQTAEKELEKKLEEVFEADEIDFETLSSWISENCKSLSNTIIAEEILEEMFELIKEEDFKTLAKKPADIFSRFETVLKRYITTSNQAQVHAVIEIERFCHDYKTTEFATSVLKYFYESEIIWQYAFLQYKTHEKDHGFKNQLLKDTAEFWKAIE